MSGCSRRRQPFEAGERFTDLRRWVCELSGFAGDPERSNEQILEAIQLAWLEERAN